MKINNELRECASRVISVKLNSGASLAQITDAAYAMDRAVDSMLGVKGNMKTKRNKDNKRIRRLKENAVEQCQGATRISKNYVGEIKNKKETESTEFCTLGFFFYLCNCFHKYVFQSKDIFSIAQIYFSMHKYIFQCTNVFQCAKLFLGPNGLSLRQGRVVCRVSFSIVLSISSW